MINAKKNKNDEFYTQLSDIENELKHYKKYFENKTVLCNCDDPRVSNFFHYFSYNFEHLKLKKLITTCYKNKQRDLFSLNDSERAIYLEYNGEMKDRIPDANKIGIKYLKGDGDFRSKECVEILKQADVVVTNPPFSLFREHVAQLIQYDKKFIIMGNVGAIAYKEIFPLIKENKMWLGASIHSGGREFGVPSHYPLKTSNYRIDKTGRKIIQVPGIRWFTNIDYEKRHENLMLCKKYNSEEYPKYDNYDAINIDKTKDIPVDYYGMMGVPITFLDKYSPDQFEIINLGRYAEGKTYGKDIQINGKDTYQRVLIKRKVMKK